MLLTGKCAMKSLDTSVINQCLALAMEDKITFVETVVTLRSIEVGRYNVDLVGRTGTYYSTAGEVYSLRRRQEHSAIVTEEFNDAGVAQAVREIKKKQIGYREFLQRIMNAGTVSYSVYLTGGRAIYFGRQGDYHVEEFS